MHWPKKSNLTYKQAELFAEKLGNDLMIVAMNYIKDTCANKQVKGCNNYDKDNIDWHDVVDAGKLCSLGWDIMYYGQEFV